MHFQISTRVEQDYKTVFSKFDVNLLKRLKPFGIGLKILRYDGCEKGNEVHAEINVLGWKQHWNTLITEKTETNNEIYFIDEGLHIDMLPKPLKIWRHRHEISKFIDSSIIIDNIAYSTKNIFIDFMLFPFIYLQFYMRKGIYKTYFKR